MVYGVESTDPWVDSTISHARVVYATVSFLIGNFRDGEYGV